ncbi:centromere protein X isoform 2-T2 [Lycaon pictus]
MEATGGGFRKELVSKLLQMHFTDSKTKVGGDALRLMAELLTIFVVASDRPRQRTWLLWMWTSWRRCCLSCSWTSRGSHPYRACCPSQDQALRTHFCGLWPQPEVLADALLLPGFSVLLLTRWTQQMGWLRGGGGQVPSPHPSHPPGRKQVRRSSGPDTPTSELPCNLLTTRCPSEDASLNYVFALPRQHQ